MAASVAEGINFSPRRQPSTASPAQSRKQRGASPLLHQLALIPAPPRTDGRTDGRIRFPEHTLTLTGTWRSISGVSEHEFQTPPGGIPFSTGTAAQHGRVGNPSFRVGLVVEYFSLSLFSSDPWWSPFRKHLQLGYK